MPGEVSVAAGLCCAQALMRFEPHGSFCAPAHNVFGLTNAWRKHGEGGDVPLAVFSRNKLFNKPIEGVLGQKVLPVQSLAALTAID